MTKIEQRHGHAHRRKQHHQPRRDGPGRFQQTVEREWEKKKSEVAEDAYGDSSAEQRLHRDDIGRRRGAVAYNGDARRHIGEAEDAGDDDDQIKKPASRAFDRLRISVPLRSQCEIDGSSRDLFRADYIYLESGSRLYSGMVSRERQKREPLAGHR